MIPAWAWIAAALGLLVAPVVAVVGAMRAWGARPVRDGVLGAGWTKDDVSIPTEDGLALSAWWIPSGPGSPVAVLLHGYRSSRSAPVGRCAEVYRRAGLSILAPDLRQHGRSPRVGPVTLGRREARDAAAAIAWARRASGGAPVLVHAESMGGTAAVAALHAADGVAAAVLDSAPVDRAEAMVWTLCRRWRMPGALARLHVALARRIYARDLGPPLGLEERLRGLDVPLLVIHGLADLQVPPDHGRRIAAAAPRANLWLVDGAGHLAASEDPGYSPRLEDWAGRWV